MVRAWDYADGAVRLRQGDEMGQFLLGSTVVLLWPAPGVVFTAEWRAERAVRLGEAMGAMG
jgi:phosphatidylserine decarboxylase